MFSSTLNTFYFLTSFVGSKKVVVSLTINTLKIIAFCIANIVIIVCLMISISRVPVNLIFVSYISAESHSCCLDHLVLFDWMLDLVFENFGIEIIWDPALSNVSFGSHYEVLYYVLISDGASCLSVGIFLAMNFGINLFSSKLPFLKKIPLSFWRWIC